VNTHNQRRQWLESHGWTVVELPAVQNIKGIGLSVRFEEQASPHRGLWMAISTGVALLDGPRDEAMTWADLQRWIEGGSEPVKKSLAGQKSLFGDDE
jgi:hypothetical protein